MHHNCPDCGGFEVDIDMANITEDTFRVLTEAQQAHRDSHVVRPTETHIRKQINPHRRRGNGFYTLQLSASENGSQTLCGAAPTTEDMGYGDTRHAKGLSYVSCENCKKIRTSGKAA